MILLRAVVVLACYQVQLVILVDLVKVVAFSKIIIHSEAVLNMKYLMISETFLLKMEIY